MLRSLLTAFRQHYPQGSVVSNLVRIHDGLYIVRVAVMVEDRTLATGLAAHSVLETAEDNACVRALSHIGLPEMSHSAPPSLVVPPPAVSPAVSPEALFPPPSTPTPTPPPVPSPTAKNGAVAQGAEPLMVDSSSTDFDGLDVDALTSESAQISDQISAQIFEPLPGSSSSLEAATIPPQPAATSFEPDLLPFEGIPTPSIDLSDIIAQTDVELQRLGWNVNQGREFLEKTYGKRSRHDLTDEELLEFLLFLETQPVPGT